MPTPSSAICSRGVCGMMASLVPLCWMVGTFGHNAATLPSWGKRMHLFAREMIARDCICFLFTINNQHGPADRTDVGDRVLLNCCRLLARSFGLYREVVSFIT